MGSSRMSSRSPSLPRRNSGFCSGGPRPLKRPTSNVQRSTFNLQYPTSDKEAAACKRTLAEARLAFLFCHPGPRRRRRTRTKAWRFLGQQTFQIRKCAVGAPPMVAVPSARLGMIIDASSVIRADRRNWFAPFPCSAPESLTMYRVLGARQRAAGIRCE
jgi:hypothetical protein